MGRNGKGPDLSKTFHRITPHGDKLFKDRPPQMVGMPNPKSVSKEEFDKRAKKLKETNDKLRKGWEAKRKIPTDKTSVKPKL